MRPQSADLFRGLGDFYGPPMSRMMEVPTDVGEPRSRSQVDRWEAAPENLRWMPKKGGQMGTGMGSGDFTEAANQIFEGDPGLNEIWISDTVNHQHQGHTDGYHAVRREGQDPQLTKYHNS